MILEPVVNINYEYDANGNMISKTVDGETTIYQYDYDNRLIQVTKPDGTVISYKYDYLGRRIEKNINGAITKYIYNGSQIIQELDNAGIVKATYVYGLGIDEPLIMERNGGTYYYYLDGLGSVTEITDTSGSMVEKYKYGPFGEPLIIDPGTDIVRESSIVFNSSLFTGREYDGEIDLYYYRARHYDYQRGRFIQTDPLGYIDGLNAYIYVHNNPINAIDSAGLESSAVNNISSTGEFDANEYLYSGIGLGVGLIIIKPGPIDPIKIIQPTTRSCLRTRGCRRKCWVKCPVIQIKPGAKCPTYTYGKACGPSIYEACRAAECLARNSTPQGCRTKHCKWYPER